MSSAAPITSHIDRASFGFWSKDEIRKISVKKLTEPKSFEKAGAMHPEGLYSNALGPVKRFETCGTCGQTDLDCPGHYGHIELEVPVYHPMLVQIMYQLLNKCCLECFHLRLSKPSLKLFLAQLEALNCGFDHLIEELDEIAADMCREGKAERDSYLQVALGKKLVARIEEEKEKIPDFECQTRPQQRSIVERLSKLFRNFINGHIIKPQKTCPNCDEKKVNLSLHQQSVLVLGVSSRVKALEESIKKSKRLKKTHEKSNIKNEIDLRFLATDEKRFVTPVGARDYLRKVWSNEKETIQKIFHFLNIHASKIEKAEKSEDQFCPVDLFFIDTILVPPPKYRPPMSQRGYSFEGPRTASLSNVMKSSIVVQDLIEQMKTEEDEIESEKLQPKLQTAWKNLQTCVNSLYDNEMDKYGKNKYPGLKQLIDKKEGLFRKNMMGKRVNFAARSVISPDPNILVDQIGVPLVFAKRLTYPTPVTPWNLKQMKEAVLNGPDQYPGAVSVVYDDGMTISLTKESVRQNVAARLSCNPRSNRHVINKQDTPMATVVNRHLLTGDVLLFNRQPTLHKPSIMAFRARVLPNEKGFRLHYANCKSFNADFDGDEMNAHLPQSELARSEAYHIASVNYQYLVPKDGSPLGGLIQDHVVAVCILTGRNQFFDKERYHQLVYCALSFLEKPLKLETPSIIRPQPLWTGKQVITTLIKNCIPPGRFPPTLDIKSKIGPKILNIKPEYEKLSDCHVIIRNGELLVGFMDKSNVGATQYGLVHTCYELYGGETSSNLMSAFARLSTWYLQLYEGFTLGIADIIVEDDSDADRQNYIRQSLTVGPDSAKEALGVIDEDFSPQMLEDKLREAHSDRDPLPMKKLDAAMKTRTDKIASSISSRCLPEGLIRRFPANNLQMMIQSGAKGGTVNALQISCLLGQIELEGRRVPLSMSGRSLPSFKPYDTSPKAGGFVSGRFLTGIQPQEFFFHCMAGREGLIDTAVKTSRSGYLQRCLIKHLEGLTVQYDQTVRDSCGSVIQFLYGEDGLDIVKSQMLRVKAFPSLVNNYKIIGPSEEEMAKLNKAKEGYEEEVISRTNDIQEWLGLNQGGQAARGSGFLDFVKHNFGSDKPSFSEELGSAEQSKQDPTEHEEQECIESKTKFSIKKEEHEVKVDDVEMADVSNTSSDKSIKKEDFFAAWYALSFKEKKKWNKCWEIYTDPLTSLMNPASHFGVVPEKLDETIGDFVQNNPQLIVDPASFLGEKRDDSGSNQESFIACDENPELSKSILAHWNESAANKPQLTKHEFYNLCYNLYMKMLAQPGEAVGLLAAQSIGEPSTQMTLNTFHFAGRGEMNVTLGIPRLREILMTASAKIGTPSMDLPLLKVMTDEDGSELDARAIEEAAKRVKLSINAVRLSDVLEYVDITEQVVNKKVDQEAASQGKNKNKPSSLRADGMRGKSIKYEITFHLLGSKYYKHEFKSNSNKVMKFIEEFFVVQLIDTMVKRSKKLAGADLLFDVSNKRTINRGSKAAGGEADEQDEEGLDEFNAKAQASEKVVKEDDSSSEDEEDADGDNTTQRIKNRRNQDLDYEEPEDDDLEVTDADRKAAEDEEGDQEVLGDDELNTKAKNPKAEVKFENDGRDQGGDDCDDGAGYEGGEEAADDVKDEDDIATADVNEIADDAALETTISETPATKKKAIKTEKSTTPDEPLRPAARPYELEFDPKRKRWVKLTVYMGLTTTRIDMGSLIETEAKRTFVHRVGNIRKAFIVKDVNAKSRGAKCDKMIKTEGVSLLALVKFNHILDLNAIYTNDIHAIANTYGIEAASQAIRREMANVFAVYGIEVDPHHLSLIADYMTYSGSIRGMNRMSMEASASPFQQMSYESTIRYLKWAAIMGLYDDIKSPSASLVFGKPARSGTGLFAMLSDTNRQTGSLD